MACIQPNFALSLEGIAGRVESRWTARREYDLLCMPWQLGSFSKTKNKGRHREAADTANRAKADTAKLRRQLTKQKPKTKADTAKPRAGRLDKARQRRQAAHLEERVLDLLSGGATVTRAKLRDSLGVKNERLGEALESLERAGRLGRTPAGWQLRD